MSTTGVTENLPASIDHLLDNLQAVTPAQMASLLQKMGSSLERTDWNALLYAIEELAETGHADQAQELMTILVEQGRLERNDWLVCAATYFLGHVYRHRGEVEQAIAAYQSAVESGMAAGDEEGQMQASLALGSISRARMAQGHISEAIAAIQKALELNEQLDWQIAEVGDRLTLANLYLSQENFAQAEALTRRSLAQAQEIDHPVYTAMAWSYLGGIQADLYDSAAALESYQNALDVLKAVEDPDDLDLWVKTYQNILANIGMAHQEREEFDEAIAAYAEAARMAAAMEDKRKQAIAITWLGTAQLDVGRAEQALRSFRAALRLSDSAGDTWWKGTIHFYQACTWQALGRFSEAKEAIRLAMQVHAAVPGEHSMDEAACLIKLGEIALERGQVGSAVAHYEEALAALREADVGSADRLVCAWLGEAYWHSGDLSRAYRTLRRALSVYETKRRTVRSPMARIDFAPSREDIYAYLVQTCLAMGRPEEAFTVVEEGRARVFREQLARQEANLDLAEALDWDQVRSLVLLGHV